MYTMAVVNGIRGKPINRILDIDGIDTMTSTDVIGGASPLPGDLEKVDRLVSVSVLATFLREYPLTYLTAEERRVYVGFQQYVVKLENRLFEEAGF